MKTIGIKNLTRSLKHPLSAGYCESFFCKLRGLSLMSRLAPAKGLVLVESKPGRLNTGIHMLGMFFDLSIIWLDNDLRVVDKVLAKRWLTIAFSRKPARYVIECAVSRYEEFKIGDKLAFKINK
jgi:uncharacterized membrane protein (UPF0127 family)